MASDISILQPNMCGAYRKYFSHRFIFSCSTTKKPLFGITFFLTHDVRFLESLILSLRIIELSKLSLANIKPICSVKGLKVEFSYPVFLLSDCLCGICLFSAVLDKTSFFAQKCYPQAWKRTLDFWILNQPLDFSVRVLLNWGLSRCVFFVTTS